MLRRNQRSSLSRLASEVQNVSNFGDEAIITAQAMLAFLWLRLEVLRVPPCSHHGLQTCSGWYSVCNGRSYRFKHRINGIRQGIVNRAQELLTRYGISLTDSQKAAFDAAEGMERVRLLSEILDSNFKGLAAATVNPFTQAENAIGDLKEALGSELRPELENTARQFTAVHPG